ncbi:ParB/Srx family N-terminal domain-containing protein [Bradyrhizobium australiense]|uniref:ParB N-terminal domain-containing protein n=1 Tax=Bradyrhizobium australiense TaxID=2721161 RepID=A0A7Y4GSY1_9BRAD|nr:ParB/Srx family N-terminal domain-containing protein [Bradyrhizobium australiense]NOJ41424.1 ParB N-terminal domain-containing protein [Bradyrhizobium australiense]
MAVVVSLNVTAQQRRSKLKRTRRQIMDALAGKAAVEKCPIERLRPYERNSRAHSAEQIEQIAASIRQCGWTMPILAADDGMVLAGYGRLAAGKLLGMTRVPLIVARGWSDQQNRAYVIADNRLTDANDWDDEMLQLELSDLFEGVSRGGDADVGVGSTRR